VPLFHKSDESVSSGEMRLDIFQFALLREHPRSAIMLIMSQALSNIGVNIFGELDALD
jgi:hypothetical protein